SGGVALDGTRRREQGRAARRKGFQGRCRDRNRLTEEIADRKESSVFKSFEAQSTPRANCVTKFTGALTIMPGPETALTDRARAGVRHDRSRGHFSSMRGDVLGDP